jgi:hypothetical protein
VSIQIQQEIDRLGGVQPLEGQYYPLSKDEIQQIKRQFGSRLPDAYVWLLSTYGAFIFVNSVQFAPSKHAPEYRHAADLGLPNGEDFLGSEVGVFYGKNEAKHTFILRQKLQVFRDRMPDGFLPFADDGFGNQLCLDLGAALVPKVYWWNHDLEWDAEDYEVETGKAMPTQAKYQNVYLVADSLEAFFKRLTISAEA